MILQVIPAGDLAMSAGQFVFTGGPDFVRQKLACRFKFFLGEWFLDQRLGMPWFRDVFVKNPNLRVIRILFRKVILDCPGVISLATFDLSFDAAQRTLAFSFHAIVTGGDVIVTPTDQDFIVDLAA